MVKLKIFRALPALIFFLLLNGCGINGYEMNGVSGQAREDYLKSIKPYGTHWVKAGGSDDDWQREWKSCGGSANGDVETGLPSGSTSDEVFFKTLHEKRAAISTCMKNHGYVFQPSTFRSENP